MYKILVPTDFSPAAKSAALYAIEIAGNLNEVELNFFHCIEVSDVSKSMVHKVEDILIKEAEDEFKSFIMKYINKAKTGVHVQYDIVFGDVENEIAKKVKSKEADLIVMGTKGAGGLKKFFLGSNASKVVENTRECPVMVVPVGAKPTAIEKLVYATDLESLISEAPLVIAFAKLFDAHLEILHVTESKIELERIDPIKKAYEMVVEHNYSAISFHQEYSLDVLEAIEKYAVGSKASIVAMFARRKNYFERLFDKSYTKEMAFHAHLPLLVIPYDLLLK
ncbi:MAG: universal stress protein [Bacteroidetes bacterium]|nr:universal stress protein [Bacteroidota bacterium]